MNNSLYIAQKLFSLWGEYSVVNEKDEQVYTVKGVPSLLRKQFVYDLHGMQIGSIQQRFTFLLPEFAISEYGREVGTISGKLSFLRTRLDMNYFHWSVEGDLMGWNYDVYDRAHHLIASIRKEIWHLSDHFAIHYEYERDALFLLLLVLAIDCICDQSKSASS